MPSNASSTQKTTRGSFIDNEKKFPTTIAAASAQLLSMDVDKVDHVGTLSSGTTLPAPQVVLDALVALSPRKNEAKVNLAPISVSQFESYTMDEQPTPVAFSFNLSYDGLLSPRSVDPSFQAFCKPDHEGIDVTSITST